jgi:hypothetical protein
MTYLLIVGTDIPDGSLWKDRVLSPCTQCFDKAHDDILFLESLAYLQSGFLFYKQWNHYLVQHLLDQDKFTMKKLLLFLPILFMLSCGKNPAQEQENKKLNSLAIE